MYEEFANREGDIVSGTVQQNDNRYTLLDLGRVEALLPQAEQIAFERYEHGARVKVYIVEVRKTNKGPQIVVSRTHPALVAKLFEIEVPEIANGIVEIKALAREPGHRAKIAVASQRPRWSTRSARAWARAASRVRNITNELRSERIDVVPYTDDPVEFIQSRAGPGHGSARSASTRTRASPRSSSTTSSCSLAIGKEGQNARLAARLTGWRIDIRSENEGARTRWSRRPDRRTSWSTTSRRWTRGPATREEVGRPGRRGGGDRGSPRRRGGGRGIAPERTRRGCAPGAELARPTARRARTGRRHRRGAGRAERRVRRARDPGHLARR